MYDNSGKGINDLGRYKKCLETEGFEYWTIGLRDIDFFIDLSMINIGLCIPDTCGAKELSSLIEPNIPLIERFVDPSGKTHFKSNYDCPYKQRPVILVGYDPRFWAAMSIFGIIILIGLFGIVI